MRIRIVALMLLLTAGSAFAQGWEIQPSATPEPVASARKAKVLRTARAAYTLPDGSQWITHSVPARREPGAIGVTRFGSDGSARVFLVSDWLPKGTIPRGWCGQVYGVALLTDGRIAVSGGWNDGRDSHNAIFVLRALADGAYGPDAVFEVAGVAQIAGGPRNSIVAVTHDVNRRRGDPLLTIFDTRGSILAFLFDRSSSTTPPEAAQNAMRAHLQWIDAQTFAVSDSHAQVVYVFSLQVLDHEVVLIPRQVFFVGEDASTATLPIVGIDANANGDVLVARTGVARGRMGTHLTVYRNDATIETAVLDRPWNLILRENGQVRGLVMKNDPLLDKAINRRVK
ncbi:MAG TPA: hypothetical protein VF698_04760 [Thermoanaerobaculia bacterium]|jgi:hypothetical protein